MLEPGARLPSWQDLAAQLGVARGTVRKAYEKLDAAQLIVASRAGRNARRPACPRRREEVSSCPRPEPLVRIYREMTRGPALFQMGVPAPEFLPATLITRIRAKAIRAEMSVAPIYPDPRGEPGFRREIARYLAVARGIDCSPSQIVVTGGFSAGLGLALRVLGKEGHGAWIEDPCFPLTRKGLELARLRLSPIPVDRDGIDVSHGLRHAPDARLVVVTPGQQAPLGATLSLERRHRLIDWAEAKQAWILEDDYLSELQLAGRAAPALASLDRAGRVIHLGSFSKTISPTLRLGFIVAPIELAARFGEAAMCLAPAPGPSPAARDCGVHARRSLSAPTSSPKACLWRGKQNALLAQLRARSISPAAMSWPAGLAVLLRLPDEISDVAMMDALRKLGMSPSPLSLWYANSETSRSGLLLGVATSPTKELAKSCGRLIEVIRRLS